MQLARTETGHFSRRNGFLGRNSTSDFDEMIIVIPAVRSRPEPRRDRQTAFIINVAIVSELMQFSGFQACSSSFVLQRSEENPLNDGRFECIGRARNCRARFMKEVFHNICKKLLLKIGTNAERFQWYLIILRRKELFHETNSMQDRALPCAPHRYTGCGTHTGCTKFGAKCNKSN